MNSRRKIAIYAGKGAKLARETAASIQSEIDSRIYEIVFVGAADIRQGTILKEVDLFAIPGGADRPYCDDLNGQGTDNILEFARYKALLLWCASTYFGGRRIEYHKGLADEVIESRLLGIFPGTIVSVDTDFGVPYNGALDTIAAPMIELVDHSKANLYFHGGAKMVPDAGHSFGNRGCKLMSIGHYAGLQDKPVAIARVNQKEGGLAFLSGVHYEFPSAVLSTIFEHSARGRDCLKIHKQLETSEKPRRMLMRSVLRQCGIQLSPEHRSIMEFLSVPISPRLLELQTA